MNFLYNPQQKTYIILEILQLQLTGFFNVVGELQWVKETRKVLCGFKKLELYAKNRYWSRWEKRVSKFIFEKT